MTLKQHDKELADIRAGQIRSQENLPRLEQALIALENQQAETKRVVEDLGRTMGHVEACRVRLSVSICLH